MSNKLPPTPIGIPPGHSYWNDWYEKLRNLINNTTVRFADLDFAGSNLTSIQTRNHNDLQSIQGGAPTDYFHLTSAQQSGLTSGANTALHFHTADRSSGANPTAALGLTAVNGSALTFMRSDAAPALDQGIAPTWTSAHIFRALVKQNGIQEAFRGVDNSTFFSGYNGADTVRTGYLQFVSGTAVNLATDSAIPIQLIINGTTIGIFNSNGLTLNSSTLLRTNTALTNGAGAAAGTITNAPSAGNPTKWVPIVDNGTTRYIPCW